MKIVFVKYSTIKKIIAFSFILLAICFIILYVANNKTKETFLDNDVYYKGTVNEKIIALACNVDWGTEYIPTMLEIFEQNNITITFFVTGTWAEKNKDMLKMIHEKGHEIGNHGYFHRDYSLLNYDLNKKEIEKADEVILEAVGVKSKYFAPPSGAYNKQTVKAAKDLGYEVIMWSIDTIDWRQDSTKDKIISRVISKPHNAAIVLMHPKEETLKALPTIIKSLTEKEYKIGKISDIIN